MSSLTFDKLACLQAPFEKICVSVKNFVRYINITHNVMKNIVIFRLQIQNNVVIRYSDGPLANTLYLIWKKAKDNICVNVYLRKIFRYEFLFAFVNMLNISYYPLSILLGSGFPFERIVSVSCLGPATKMKK